MEEELKFEDREVDFNFNIRESKYKTDQKIKIEFDLQYILDYLHQKKVVVFEGDPQEDIGNKYGIEIKNTRYYYVGTEKKSVLEIFQKLLYQDLEKVTK